MEIIWGFREGSKEELVKESTKWGESQVEAADRKVFVAVTESQDDQWLWLARVAARRPGLWGERGEVGLGIWGRSLWAW